MTVSLGLSFYVAVLGVAVIYILDVVWGSAQHDAAGHPFTQAPDGNHSDNETDHEASGPHNHSPPYEIVFVFGTCVFGGNLLTVMVVERR